MTFPTSSASLLAVVLTCGWLIAEDDVEGYVSLIHTTAGTYGAAICQPSLRGKTCYEYA